MDDIDQSFSWRLWQGDRFPPALDPTHFPLDGRTAEDNIAWVTGFSRLLTYFAPDGTRHDPPLGKGGVAPWEAFFRFDLVYLLAEMAAYRPGPTDPHNDGILDRDLLDRVLSWVERGKAIEKAAMVEAGVNSVEGEFATAVSATYAQEIASVESIARQMARQSAPVAQEVALSVRDQTILKHSLLFGPLDSTRAATLLQKVAADLSELAKGLLKRCLNETNAHPAQSALVLAFQTLMETPTARLNKLTEEHLNFYYRKVLRLQPRAYVPDQVYVCVQTSPGIRSAALPAGTSLLASSGGAPPVLFRTDHDIDVNQCELQACRILRVLRERTAERVRNVSGVLTSEIASQKTLTFPPGGTPIFGPDTPTSPSMQPAAMGFAIASPILALAGGVRHVTVSLTLAPGQKHTPSRALCDLAKAARQLGTDVGHLLERGLQVSISTAKGPVVMMPQLSLQLEPGGTETGVLKLQFDLAATDPALAAEDGQAAPLLRIVLSPSAPFYLYSSFVGLRLLSARIETSVQGLNSAMGLVASAAGVPVDPTKAFRPFGANPIPGDSLLFAAPELTGRKLSSVTMRFQWSGMPTETLGDYYANYDLGIETGSFKVSLAANREAEWHELSVVPGTQLIGGAGVSLFHDLPDGSATSPSTMLVWNTSGLRSAPLQTGKLKIDPARPDGLFRLTFSAPQESFGTKAYASIVATRALDNARKIFIFGKPAPLPKPPVSLKVSSFEIDYTASVEAQAPFYGTDIVFYEIAPFAPLVPQARPGIVPPDLHNAAYTTFGFKGLMPGDRLSLLFRIMDNPENAARPASGDERRRLIYAYRTTKGWRRLPPDAIQHDGTDQLATTGILSIALPFDIAFGDGLSWLSVTARGDVSGFGSILGVETNAVLATRVITEPTQEGAEPDAPLPADSIKKTETAVPGIGPLAQPEQSFGGRVAETTKAYRTRVAERLGHRNRAIAPIDYPTLVLEAFPNLSDAVVIPAPPGIVALVVVPRRAETGPAVRPALPIAARRKIARWLKDRAGFGVENVLVFAPKFETVQARGRVAVVPGTGSAVVDDVSRAIDRLIAPWLFDVNAPVPVGQGSLSASDISAGLSAFSDRAKLTGLSLVQVYSTAFEAIPRREAPLHLIHGLKDTARVPDPEMRHVVLQPSTPWSVLVPAASHQLELMPASPGIGDLAVDSDFDVVGRASADYYRSNPDSFPAHPTPVGIGSLVLGESLVIETAEAAIPPEVTDHGDWTIAEPSPEFQILSPAISTGGTY